MIKKFDLKFSKEEEKDFLRFSKDIISRGFLAESKYVEEFSKRFKDYQLLKYGVMVGSGTDALQAAFSSHLSSGDEILIPSNTFVATYIAADQSKLKIKLTDVNENDGMIDLDVLKKSISKNTKAVCIVHIGGAISNDIFKIKKFCKENKILLIEDAAHCVGSSYKGISAGNFGDFGCFSFFPTKTMTTGEGGFVSTQNKKNFNTLKAIKNFGRTKPIEDWHEIKGYNMKVTEFQAALGLVELNRIESRVKKRRSLFEIYLNKLKSKNVEILNADNFHESSCYKIIMKADKKFIKKVESSFKDNKISLTGKVYSKQIGQHNAYKNEKTFQNSQKFIENHFCPPLYPELTNENIHNVCKILNKL
tara:strand:+ start:731 stop:1819 length:1089 start_codon:yes stop_codon:yes gene_type:complete